MSALRDAWARFSQVADKVALRLKVGAPADILATARARGIVLPAEYYGTRQGLARQLAFSIAGVNSLDQLQAVKDSLDRALATGDDFAAWRKRVLRGEVPLNLPDHRLETIFRTNLQTVYSRGNGARIMRNLATHPYLLYSAVNDSRTRPAHRAMNGTILLATDPWWNTHRPPNGYNCRCRVIALTEAEAKRRGITKVPPNAPPDPGWDYDPWADPRKGVATAIQRRRAKLAPELVKKLEQVAQQTQAMTWTNVATTDEAIALGKRELQAVLSEAAGGNGAAFDATDAAHVAAFREKLAERIEAVHGKPVAVAVTDATGVGYGKARKTLEDAGRSLPSTWVSATNGHGELHVYGMAPTGRGSHWTNETGKPAYYAPGRKLTLYPAGAGVLRLRAGDFPLAVHEFAHRIQYSIPELDKMFQDYYHRRTQGEALNSLARLTGIGGYRSSERARADQWFDPYVGKWYDFRGAGRTHGALEVITMALQYLLGRKQSEFEAIMRKDPELVEFTVGMLLGWKP